MNSPMGMMSRTSINMSLFDFYAAHPNSTRILLLPHDLGSDVVSAATAALDLMTNQEVHAIIGPQRSLDAAFVADLATKAQVPVVSSSAISPLLMPSQTPYFVRAAPNNAAQANTLAALVQAFGWRRVVPIYEDSDYGTPFVPFLIDAFYAVGVQVPYRCALPASAPDERIFLEPKLFGRHRLWRSSLPSSPSPSRSLSLSLALAYTSPPFSCLSKSL